LPRPRFDDEDDDDWTTNGQSGWFERFSSDGLITEVLMPLASGKEASVYLCRANPGTTGATLLAAKAFRPRTARSFHNRARYREGVVILDARARRAMAARSRFGREVDEAIWRDHEFETLRTLSSAGADVPAPVAMADDGILMAYLGDEDHPAPQLRDVPLAPPEARRVFDRLIANVELMLANNLVHADLSPYNVLYWDDRPTIIDFPQAVDPRTNNHARALLVRDVDNLCRHFERFGVRTNADGLAGDLWRRFVFAKL
jgi:RIO kinase 1